MVLGSLDPAKLLVILVVALVVLGPERLPRAARQLGIAWRELTRIREEVREEVRSAIPEMDVPRIPPGSVSGFLRDLTASARPGPDAEGAPDPARSDAVDPIVAGATAVGTGATGGAGSAEPLEADWQPSEPGSRLREHVRSPTRVPAGPMPGFCPDDPGMN